MHRIPDRDQSCFILHIFRHFFANRAVLTKLKNDERYARWNGALLACKNFNVYSTWIWVFVESKLRVY